MTAIFISVRCRFFNMSDQWHLEKEQKFQNQLHYFVPDTDTPNILHMDEQGFWMDSNGFRQSGTLILIDPEFTRIFAYLLLVTQFTSTEAIFGKKNTFVKLYALINLYFYSRKHLVSSSCR